METQEKTVKRKRSVSARQRFETLKRDKFTCQYCGAKAPDVALHVDHIVPFAKGGTCDIMNLVTSCAQCNGGKSDKKLSDDTAVVKSRKQAELSQDRKRAVGEMAKWQAELAVMDEEISALNTVLSKMINRTLSDKGKSMFRPLIKAHGIRAVLEAMSDSVSASGTLEIEDVGKRLKSAKFKRDHPERSAAIERLNKMLYNAPRSKPNYWALKEWMEKWGKYSKWKIGHLLDELEKRSDRWESLFEYTNAVDENMRKKGVSP